MISPTTMEKIQTKHLPLLSLFIFITCGLYYFGLRPFNFFPKNQVENVNSGLKFGPIGIAFTEDKIKVPQITSVTLEFALTPSSLPQRNVPLIFSFIDNNHILLTIGQWKESLLIRSYDKTTSEKPFNEISSSSVLSVEDDFFITIASASDHGAIYINGKLVRESNVLGGIGAIFKSGTQMVMGNSPSGTNAWRGTISTFALYTQKLPENLIKEHYHRYHLGTLDYTESKTPFLFYNLSNRENNNIYDRMGNNDLLVPWKFRALKRDFLVPIWVDFTFTRAYITDILVNFWGFLPFGVAAYFFYTIFSKQPRKAAVLAVLSGLLISLSIEIIQITLPTRSSQMADLLFNTLGTLAGVLLVCKARKT